MDANGDLLAANPGRHTSAPWSSRNGGTVLAGRCAMAEPLSRPWWSGSGNSDRDDGGVDVAGRK